MSESSSKGGPFGSAGGRIPLLNGFLRSTELNHTLPRDFEVMIWGVESCNLSRFSIFVLIIFEENDRRFVLDCFFLQKKHFLTEFYIHSKSFVTLCSHLKSSCAHIFRLVKVRGVHRFANLGKPMCDVFCVINA